VAREELKLIYSELGGSTELIPWATFGPEVLESAE